MQKLSGISSSKNNKSCRIIHNGSNKIGFVFSDFSMIFYAIYKIQPRHFYYLGYNCREALEKNSSFAMWSLGGPAGAARQN
jgi:hypothetical protein